jgi:hypothetical protein
VVTTNAQKVEYVKGLSSPDRVAEGQLLKVGQVVSTTAKGRIILAYAWRTKETDYSCEAYWILNGGLVKRVPDLQKSFQSKSTTSGGHINNCGNTTAAAVNEAFSDKATGISIIAFSGYPGKGGGDPNEIFRRSVVVKRPIDIAIYRGLADLPRSFTGKVTSIDAGKILIDLTDETGKTEFSGELAKDVEIQGAASPQELLESNVYVEYNTGSPNKVGRIFRTTDDLFYRFLGFEQQLSYADDCAQLPEGKFCLKFDDGHVWLVEGDKPQIQQPKTRNTLKLQTAISANGEYQHLLGTSYVLKIPYDKIE